MCAAAFRDPSLIIRLQMGLLALPEKDAQQIRDRIDTIPCEEMNLYAERVLRRDMGSHRWTNQLSPGRKSGEGCIEDANCIDGTCEFFASRLGVCHPRLAAGMACQHSTQCAKELYCGVRKGGGNDASGIPQSLEIPLGVDGTCLPRRGVGQTCRESVAQDLAGITNGTDGCVLGAACDVLADRCVARPETPDKAATPAVVMQTPPARDGAECEPTAEPLRELKMCGWGRFCRAVGAKHGQCTKWLGLEAACDPKATYPQCTPFRTRCDEKRTVCVPNRAPFAPCTETEAIGIDFLHCDDHVLRVDAVMTEPIYDEELATALLGISKQAPWLSDLGPVSAAVKAMVRPRPPRSAHADTIRLEKWWMVGPADKPERVGFVFSVSEKSMFHLEVAGGCSHDEPWRSVAPGDTVRIEFSCPTNMVHFVQGSVMVKRSSETWSDWTIWTPEPPSEPVDRNGRTRVTLPSPSVKPAEAAEWSRQRVESANALRLTRWWAERKGEDVIAINVEVTAAKPISFAVRTSGNRFSDDPEAYNEKESLFTLAGGETKLLRLPIKPGKSRDIVAWVINFEYVTAGVTHTLSYQTKPTADSLEYIRTIRQLPPEENKRVGK
ncbi:MAG: hypothetical protein NVS3B20_02360 [Polyangiales bacterium]